jgi:hypothetical protein
MGCAPDYAHLHTKLEYFASILGSEKAPDVGEWCRLCPHVEERKEGGW